MYIELGVKAATVTQNGLKIFTMQISGDADGAMVSVSSYPHCPDAIAQ